MTHGALVITHHAGTLRVIGRTQPLERAMTVPPDFVPRVGDVLCLWEVHAGLPLARWWAVEAITDQASDDGWPQIKLFGVTQPSSIPFGDDSVDVWRDGAPTVPRISRYHPLTTAES